MGSISEILLNHAGSAHWWIFGLCILAGFNLPISIDVLLVATAFLAAVIIPEHCFHLFFSFLIGCYLSAWCSYVIGRFLGEKLLQWGWFRKLFPEKKREQINRFYTRFGLWTFVFGRFIPFGVRNCIFMTTGLSKVSFKRFIAIDAVACSLWVSTMFILLYTLSQNYECIWERIWSFLKTFNMVIFAAFSVTVIGFLWYKKRKRASRKALSN